MVDTGLIKKVAILKGPSSALYGSDELAGVVSYMTKDPADLHLLVGAARHSLARVTGRCGGSGSPENGAIRLNLPT